MADRCAGCAAASPGAHGRAVSGPVAEALFWTGRCVERADSTARLLRAWLPALDPRTARDDADGHDAARRALLAVAGVDPDRAPDPPDRSRVLRLLAHDPASSPWTLSITASLAVARRCARASGPGVPEEVRDALDAADRSLASGRWLAQDPGAFLAWVRACTATVTGLLDATAPRDEGWSHLVAGRGIERADATARLVASTAARVPGAPGWPAVLRACGVGTGADADTALRTDTGPRASAGAHPDTGASTEAARLLLLDRSRPRSVVHALDVAERALGDLEAAAGVPDQARRILARARADLEYRPFAEVLARLPQQVRRVQRACSAASEEITRSCFVA